MAERLGCSRLASAARGAHRGTAFAASAPRRTLLRSFVLATALLAAPALAAVPLATVTRIGAGAAHVCALVAGGVMCWGDNQYGQLGNGSRERALGATRVSGLETGAIALSIGYSSLHHCAVVTGGAVRCWGRNGTGQLGDGTFTDSLVPLTVPGLVNVAAVVTGGDHTCALTATGGVKCLGGGHSGQLGDGNGQVSVTPVDVLGLTSGVAEIAAGYRHMCARTTGGAVKCWGFNQFGQIGNGTVNVIATSPADVTGLASGTVALGAGYHHACAATGGGVKCWGWNGSGQLGNGTQTNSPTPVDVTGLGGGVVQLALGQMHSCARGRRCGPVLGGEPLRFAGQRADGRVDGAGGCGRARIGFGRAGGRRQLQLRTTH